MSPMDPIETVTLTRDGQLLVAEILPYAPAYAADFRDLNMAWLRRYFKVEPIDEEVLSQPERILAAGGAILFARVEGTVVGTVALLPSGERRYELSKMAVSPAWQGVGLGRALLSAMIRVYHALGGEQLFLESNHRLVPALQLYESVGFRHAPRPEGPSHYERADVYMTYDAGVR